MDHRLVYLIHILVVAPLFWYIGSNGPETNPRVFEALKYTAIVLAVYHGLLLVKSTKQDNFNEINEYNEHNEQSDDDSDIQQVYDGEL